MSSREQGAGSKGHGARGREECRTLLGTGEVTRCARHGAETTGQARGRRRTRDSRMRMRQWTGARGKPVAGAIPMHPCWAGPHPTPDTRPPTLVPRPAAAQCPGRQSHSFSFVSHCRNMTHSVWPSKKRQLEPFEWRLVAAAAHWRQSHMSTSANHWRQFFHSVWPSKNRQLAPPECRLGLARLNISSSRVQTPLSLSAAPSESKS